MMIAWFFAPPIACTRLPCAVPVVKTCSATARRPDEAHRANVGIRQDRVDGLLVAVDDIEHTGRRSRFHKKAPPSATERSGPFRWVLQTKGVAGGDGDARTSTSGSLPES